VITAHDSQWAGRRGLICAAAAAATLRTR
jgi:hypothetical protein